MAEERPHRGLNINWIGAASIALSLFISALVLAAKFGRMTAEVERLSETISEMSQTMAVRSQQQGDEISGVKERVARLEGRRNE
jgi:archaellum component FlaG (FlaF/FlaG flagellin family)